MRVQDGAIRRTKNGGWLHKINGHAAVDYQPSVKKEYTRDWTKLLFRCASETPTTLLADYATRLGVTEEALASLGCCYCKEHNAWLYPMSDGDGNIIGARLRRDDGGKFAVEGSKQGIFLPVMELSDPLFACEGPTDCAAALSIGLSAVGRPSCTGGNEHIVKIVNRYGIKRAIIVADNDAPGLAGAKALARELRRIKTVRWCPPAKDLRAFVGEGGTKEYILCMIQSLRFQ